MHDVSTAMHHDFPFAPTLLSPVPVGNTLRRRTMVVGSSTRRRLSFQMMLKSRPLPGWGGGAQ
eukprot:9770971-Alexandrium_andersonii.AAC.1